MKVKKWFGLVVTSLLLVSTLYPAGVFAKADRTIEDESIYDLLVDRFNNGDGRNDYNVDTQDLSAFNGGDFTGIETRLEHIAGMGFTIISLGPVFATESYDGSKVLDYTKLEPQFGTDKEFNAMIKAIHKREIAVIADFPFAGVSVNHLWAQEGTFKAIPAANGTIDWDHSDVAVQQALKEAVVNFVETYKLDGIRLTKIAKYDTAFVNEVIAAVKAVNPEAYVLTNEESDANLDAMPNMDKMNALRKSFVVSDADASSLTLFTEKDSNGLVQLDDLIGQRYTYDIVEARMFPPTRWKLAATALFSMPGTPIMPYGTEIAMNGKAMPENHQLMNYKVEQELVELIADLNTLRNQSETFRKGDFEILYNEEGFSVFKRSSDKETWIIAINNTTHTSNFAIPKDVIGDNKKLRGVLGGDLVKEAKDGMFRVVLEREVAEIYIADEDKGFNIPYLIASILIYVFFLGFLYIVWKKGRQGRKGNNVA